MARICSALSNAGFDCVLIGRKRKKSKRVESVDYDQKRLFCFFEKGKLFYLEFNIRLLFYLLFSKMDAICSIDLDTAMPGMMVAKLRRKKFIFDAHELFTEVPEVKDRKNVKR